MLRYNREPKHICFAHSSFVCVDFELYVYMLIIKYIESVLCG